MARALGRYELLRPLARGGMAEVYLARRRAAGVEKWLVVKRMRPERAGDARFLDLFVREARLSMSLTHQNIVPVFDFGRIDDQVFLAMERIEGKDLGSSLAKAGEHRLPPVLAAFIAAECCQALDYAHNRRGSDGALLGIVHRDVTPRNVLLSWSGEVKLTDFGIAALAGDEPHRTIGTPAYMAPEQARGETVDLRADIYAVGLVLREAVTGIRPRPGDEKEATLAAARAGQLAPWPEGVSAALMAIADKATSLDPKDRYPDARTMLEELDAFIVSERSAKKGDAPARLLAAWLSTVWKEEREEVAIDEAIEGNHLVSFMDDGALDVVGTGTMRSMMATAGDEPPPSPALVEKPPLPTTQATEGPPALPPVARRSRWPLVAAASVLVLAGGVAALFVLRPDAQPGQVPPEPEAKLDLPNLDPQPKQDPPKQDPPKQDPPKQDPPKQDPPKQDPPKQDPPKQDPTRHVTQRHDPKNVGSATAPPVLPPPPIAKLYRVTINTKPWSNFTIDGDAAQHQTLATVELTAGPHTIHFNNPTLGLSKDITITVPENDELKIVESLR